MCINIVFYIALQLILMCILTDTDRHACTYVQACLNTKVNCILCRFFYYYTPISETWSKWHRHVLIWNCLFFLREMLVFLEKVIKLLTFLGVGDCLFFFSSFSVHTCGGRRGYSVIWLLCHQFVSFHWCEHGMSNTLIVKPPYDNVCGTIRMKSPSQELVLNSQTYKDSVHFGYIYFVLQK